MIPFDLAIPVQPSTPWHKSVSLPSESWAPEQCHCPPPASAPRADFPVWSVLCPKLLDAFFKCYCFSDTDRDATEFKWPLLSLLNCFRNLINPVLLFGLLNFTEKSVEMLRLIGGQAHVWYFVKYPSLAKGSMTLIHLPYSRLQLMQSSFRFKFIMLLYFLVLECVRAAPHYENGVILKLVVSTIMSPLYTY